MLTLTGLTKAYGGRTLFADAALQVNRGDRVGLVGPNGAGKSTLFRLILGTEQADGGTVSIQRGMTVGYLPQETAPVGAETVLEIALSGWPEVVTLRQRLRAPLSIEAELSGEAGVWRRQFEALEGHRLEARARHILSGLGFRPHDVERSVGEMSGGWVMRAHLARLLVLKPDLMLLDEPTNHLDLESLLWFQEHLREYEGGILLISHDRDFLNRLAGTIIEIRQSQLICYRGNYDAYLAQREAREEQQLAAWKHQQREIARLQTFVDRFRAKNTKASQAQSKLKQIERMDVIEAPGPQEATVRFVFPQPDRSGQKVIMLENVECAYGSNVVYAQLNLTVERGQKVVLVGPNGAGKSTLLKTMARVLVPRSGEVRLGHNVRVGYYSQNRVELLHAERTVLEEALETPQALTEVFVRTVLGTFLFRGDDVFKRVSVLSGGEKSRLSLVKLLLDPPNLLLMDEPTTHLDLASVDALLEALRQFQGTLVFISHDVYFIRSLANHVVQVRTGRLRHFPGDYQYYLDKTAAEDAAATARLEGQQSEAGRLKDQQPTSAELAKARKRQEAELRQARYQARREQAELVRKLEAEILRLEAREAELTAELQDPAVYGEPGRGALIAREFRTLRERLAEVMPQWEDAATQLDAMEHRE